MKELEPSEQFQRIEKRKTRVAVIGAGVIGLSTAMLAQEAGYEVTIYSDKQPMATTSAEAAASFKPHEVAYTQLTQRMVERGWEDYKRITTQWRDFSSTLGVREHIHWEASSSPKESAPYLTVMENFEVHERPNVPGGYAFGWKYRTFFIDVPIYLQWLKGTFLTNNGRFVLLDKKFEDVEEFRKLQADVVFNCTGLGARDLCHDYKMRPIKGQIVQTDPQPDMDWSISADGFYVYPRKHETILGGTVEPNVEDKTVENGAIHLIIRGNKRILPHLAMSSVRGTYAGLRPYREGEIRVEAEEIGDKRIIHHYGHGGAGFTLSWGSAREALKLL